MRICKKSSTFAAYFGVMYKKEKIMRKNLLLAVFCLCALIAHAGSYAYLVFTNTAGTTTAFGVNNLTMHVNGSNLQVTNDEGTVNLMLTELAAMQFSTSADSITAIENVLDADQPVQVFSISGISLGSFSSLVEAAQHLDAGVYVISNGKKSQTIVIK